MENYKIKVNNAAESKEAQELLFELGYSWHGNKKQVSYLESIDEGEFSHLLAWSVGSFEKVIQMGCGSEDAKEFTIPKLRDLVASHRKPTEQGLISGKEALIALANGEVVEVRRKQTGIGWSSAMTLNMFNFRSSLLEFRIKPRTIKLELEIPAPFEPKDGETYWFITDSECGYNWVENKQGCRVGIAAWRTESEIKQVVAALRGALKNG